ncbi:unnamed protein product [Peronospora belbahrii]|nr:unnamed protein product [Peronospora belbahrii]
MERAWLTETAAVFTPPQESAESQRSVRGQNCRKNQQPAVKTGGYSSLRQQASAVPFYGTPWAPQCNAVEATWSCVRASGTTTSDQGLECDTMSDVNGNCYTFETRYTQESPKDEGDGASYKSSNNRTWQQETSTEHHH